MHDRFLLLKRRRDLTPQEQWVLESWTLWFPTLARAYEAKENFYSLWDLADRQAAKERMESGLASCHATSNWLSVS